MTGLMQELHLRSSLIRSFIDLLYEAHYLHLKGEILLKLITHGQYSVVVRHFRAVRSCKADIASVRWARKLFNGNAKNISTLFINIYELNFWSSRVFNHSLSSGLNASIPATTPGFVG